MKLTTRTFAAGATVAGLGALAAIAMAAGGDPATPAATVEPIAQPPRVKTQVVRTTVHVTKHRPAPAPTTTQAAPAAAPAPAPAAAATPVVASRAATPASQPVAARDDDGSEYDDDGGAEDRDDRAEAGDDHGDDDHWEYEDD